MNRDMLDNCRCAAATIVFGVLFAKEGFAVRAVASAAVMGIRSLLN
jgi:hypothetical protein